MQGEFFLLPTTILKNRSAGLLYFAGRCLLAGVFLWSGLTKIYQPTVFAETIGACTEGVRSAFAWTVHELAGLQTAKNYQGGMTAWRQIN